MHISIISTDNRNQYTLTTLTCNVRAYVHERLKHVKRVTRLESQVCTMS
jgi:hypothetical protein